MITQPYRVPRLVRAVLATFPPAFRARYGQELCQCIRDARRDLESETSAATIRFWMSIVADLARSALVERYRSIPPGFWPLMLRRTAGALLIAAAVANVAYDVVSIKLSMGVFTALLTGASAIAGTLLIRSGPRRFT